MTREQAKKIGLAAASNMCVYKPFTVANRPKDSVVTKLLLLRYAACAATTGFMSIFMQVVGKEPVYHEELIRSIDWGIVLSLQIIVAYRVFNVKV